MQKELFAEDVLETMQFIASLLSQYLAAHSRCVNEWNESQDREERTRKSRERRARKAEGPPTASESPSSSSSGAGSADVTDQDDNYADVLNLAGITCCPPYGHPKLFATYSTRRNPDLKSVELLFKDGVLEGDGIHMTYDHVTVEGVTYQFQWSNPLNIHVKNESVTLVITA